jgi:putative transposase
MLIRKAFRFRLKTNSVLNKQLIRYTGHARFLWNKSLALNLSRLKQGHRILRYEELDFWSKIWKRSDEYKFLKECPSQVLQQKLMDLDHAMMDAFDPKQPNKRLPRFKKRGLSDGFRYPQGFKILGNQIYLPKIGWIRFRRSQPLVGIPKNVTVSYTAGYWYISVQTEYSLSEQPHPATSMVGLDLGVARFATLSTGEYFNGIQSFRTHEERLGKEQRRLSHRKKFSKNWQKQKRKVQRLHHRIAHVRSDYLHKLSTHLSKNHAIIVLEDLKIKNMSASAKGSLENPGIQVKAKSGLNKSILDQGWYKFKSLLSYKQAWRKGEVLLVNPRFTSQTCPYCDQIDKKSRLSQSEFCCTHCGYRNHADTVGAINVLRAGHARLACSGIG